MKEVKLVGVGDQIWEALKKKRAVFLYRNFLNEDTGTEEDVIGVVSHFQRDAETGSITGVARLFEGEIPDLLEIPNEVVVGFRVPEEPTDLEFLLTPFFDRCKEKPNVN